MKRYPFEFETEVGKKDELMLYCRGYVAEYVPATMYRNNGDPGDPAEGGEVEIEEMYVTDENGIEIDYLLDDDWLDDMCILHTDFDHYERDE